jgi:hydroxyethylthiazole kinase-like uncharacterized protein yjeF
MSDWPHPTSRENIDAIVQRNVDAQLLRSWPLPDPESAADKDERGRVLIIGGSSEIPGATILAALGAMRAGSGKICVVTTDKTSHIVASALPEARVIGLKETERGGLQLDSSIDRLPHDVDALLIGPGMQDETATVALTNAVLDRCANASIVLDAYAMSVINSAAFNASAHTSRNSSSIVRSIVITPHPGEMAHLTGRSKEDIQCNLRDAALEAAARWRVVVAMKSATTFIAAADGALWKHEGGSVGLGISGSGDVLAGVIVGLCARGAAVDQATVWGVALHARSGAALAKRFGPIGYLAREIPHEVPALMHELASGGD